MGGICSTYGERRGVCRVMVGKPEGKRPLERPTRRWEDNIKMVKLYKQEFNDLYCSPDIVRATKWSRMRWAGYVARMGRGEGYTGLRWGNLKQRDHWRDLGVDGKIILRWIFRK